MTDPNDPRYSDTPNVDTHPLEGRGPVPADPPSPLTAEERSDPAQFIAIARRLHLAEHQCDGNCGQPMLRGDGVEGRLYRLGVRVLMTERNADPPSPLTEEEERIELILKDIEDNRPAGAYPHLGDRRNRLLLARNLIDAGLTLDAARAPDAGLRAAILAIPTPKRYENDANGNWFTTDMEYGWDCAIEAVVALIGELPDAE